MSDADPELGIPAGSLQEATGELVPQGRLQHHLRQPQLLSRASTIPKSTAR